MTEDERAQMFLDECLHNAGKSELGKLVTPATKSRYFSVSTVIRI